MSTATEIQLDPTNALTEDGWAVLVVKSIGANIKRKSGTGERTVWATLESPHNHELKIALDWGAEPGKVPPAGVLPLEALSEMVYDVIGRLELALDDAEGKNQEEGW